MLADIGTNRLRKLIALRVDADKLSKFLPGTCGIPQCCRAKNKVSLVAAYSVRFSMSAASDAAPAVT